MTPQLSKSNLTKIISCLCLIVLSLSCSLSVSLFAQDKDQKDQKDQKKKQDKAAKAEENASKQQASREKRYQKILAFSQEKYRTDPDFKDGVDDQYREVRQRQTRAAYETNMRPSNYKLVNKDDEKLTIDDALYDNPLAQDYINRVGQSLVPPSSNKLFAFKILQNPVPESKSYSTGTVYITTGYLALIDNEAQLAYILGHEISHIEKDHWFQDILVQLGTAPYQEKNEKFATFMRALATSYAVRASQNGTNSDSIAAASILKLLSLNESFQWETVQEDEADLEAMKYMFARNYDVREIPKLYARMKEITADPRSQTGFIADPDRIKQRLAIFTASSQQYVKTDATVGAANLSDKSKNLALTGMRGIARMLNETMAPEIQKRLDAGELIASSEEFQSVMALVKRDNGIRAFQFDMFEMARNNLENSLSIRSNDPAAYYYFGKVLKQTARNSSEMSKALQNLTQAIALDQRQTIAEPYLFRAMLRLGGRNPNEAQLIAQDLKTYVSIYQRENKGELPPNMEFIYDFMQDLGIMDYRMTPATNTAVAPNSVAGSRPTVGENVENKTSEPAPVVTATPVAAPARKTGRKP